MRLLQFEVQEVCRSIPPPFWVRENPCKMTCIFAVRLADSTYYYHPFTFSSFHHLLFPPNHQHNACLIETPHYRRLGPCHDTFVTRYIHCRFLTEHSPCGLIPQFQLAASGRRSWWVSQAASDEILTGAEPRCLLLSSLLLLSFCSTLF